MALNTGCSSPGDAANEVAQHISSTRGLLFQRELAQLVEQPRVLDGDNGLAAKSVTSSICFSVNERTVLTVDE